MTDSNNITNVVIIRSGFLKEVDGKPVDELTVDDILKKLAKVDEYHGSLSEYNRMRGKIFKKFKPMTKYGKPSRFYKDSDLDAVDVFLDSLRDFGDFYYTTTGITNDKKRENFQISEYLLDCIANGCEALVSKREIRTVDYIYVYGLPVKS